MSTHTPSGGTGDELERILSDVRLELATVELLELRRELWQPPSAGYSLAALGLALLRLGHAEAAARALDRAHWEQPDNPDILLHYGRALEQAGFHGEARRRFEAAARLQHSREEQRSAPPPPPRETSPDQSALTTVPPAAPAPPLELAAPPPAAPRTFPPGHGPVPAPVAAGTPGTPPHPARPLLTPPPIPAATARTGPPPSLDQVEWEPPPPPGFGALVGSAIQLWSQGPLLWLVLLGVPNLAAAAAVALLDFSRWVAPLCWLLALALGGAPVAVAMLGQLRQDRSPPGQLRLTARRYASGTLFLLALLAFTSGPVVFLTLARSTLRGEVALLAGLLFALPFHALLAPAFMLILSGEVSPGLAVRHALRLGSLRTFLHLAVMVTAGVLLGAGLLLVGSFLDFLLQEASDFAVARAIFRIAGISLGESVWLAFLALCGTDALDETADPETGEWNLRSLEAA